MNSERKFKRGSKLLVALGAAGVVTASAATGLGLVETRVAIERPASSDRHAHTSEHACSGADRVGHVEIVPDAVVSRRGRERIEYHSEIALHRGKNVGVAWNADVIDDRGRIVATLDAGSARKGQGEVAFTKALAADLPDGFYGVRVRAAVAPSDEPADVFEAIQHVEVKGGRWAELSPSEWSKRSRANEVFQVADAKGGL